MGLSPFHPFILSLSKEWGLSDSHPFVLSLSKGSAPPNELPNTERGGALMHRPSH